MKKSNSQTKDTKKEEVRDDFSGEELRDVSPKFLGMDYFRVIYVAATVLIVLMFAVYFSIDDERV